MIWTSPEGVSNGGSPGSRLAGRPAGSPDDRRQDLAERAPEASSGAFARIPLGSMWESPCDGVWRGAILSGPSAPETYAGDAQQASWRGRRQRSSGLVGWTSIGRSAALALIPGPCPPHLINRQPRTQVLSNEWTPSRSGEPPWVNSRSHCRPPITRRGCATPSSSTSTSSGSGSPSRMASPRTGSRPATARSSARRWPGSSATASRWSSSSGPVAEPDGRRRRRRRRGGARSADRTASPQVRVEATRVGGEGGATNLNPRYTFANFIVGSANRLGHAASLSVAERPGSCLQPAVPVRRGRPRQDPPDACDRQPGDRPLPAQARRLCDVREVHERIHHEHPAGQDRRVPQCATDASTCSSSTTSSSSPTRSGPRKSSSTRSTPSTRTASRSSSRATDRPRPS